MSKIKYIFSAVLAVILLFTLSACSISSKNKSISISSKELLYLASEYKAELYVSNKKVKDMKKVASSGFLEMYLDENTLSICILDTISGKLWRSLPYSDTKKETATLTADIIIKGRQYTLNSQRDSLALGCISYEIIDNGLAVSYAFRRNLENGKKLDITIPVKFTLSDGTLLVNLDCGNITDNSETDVYIESVSILPFLGADSKGEKGDFILLPSASGVILDTKSAVKDFAEISLPVYGEDIAENKVVTSYVPIGAFGMKKGSSAFVCLINDGESLADIKAQKALTDGTPDSVSAEFRITPSLVTDKTIYLAKDAHKGRISLSYRFLSGNNADYITMAGACRELLIRQGRLRDSGRDISSGYPFSLTLISDTPEKGQTTSQQEAEELITSLITKGIGNINIILSGENREYVPELSAFSKKENLGLSLESNLFSYGKKGTVTLSGDRSDINIRKISETADEIINTMRSTSTGVFLSDCGNILPTDYSRHGLTRSSNLSDISKICTLLSSHGTVTVSRGNIYTVKYADSIINIPEKSPLENITYCKSVPFLQAVLHGICDYSFTPMNLNNNPTKAMLKSVEYGAVPHYEWYFASFGEDDAYHYSNSLSQARLVYENMKAMFSDLRDQRITSHEEVKKNVMLTTYSGGSEIYVNYNNKAVSVSGITLDPMGFMRVN